MTLTIPITSGRVARAGSATAGAVNERSMKRMASNRVAVLSRNRPRTAEVTVDEPGLRTPRIDMHRCSASMTTSTPRGWRVRSISSAIWAVRRSWTCGRLA